MLNWGREAIESRPGSGFFVDRVSRLPRLWSNQELRKYAGLFDGDIVNVSAWADSDKEGAHYRDYFTRAASYRLTNYLSDARGLQGHPDEIFLDLEDDLPGHLQHRFDVVFNHTTLEHVYEMRKAFSNLCAMSKDVVIIVLPFLQQYHSDYGDFWRFTPLAVKKLFEENDFDVVYQSFNGNKNSSVYVFTIASRSSERWKDQFEWTYTCVEPRAGGREPFVGARAISNWRFRLAHGAKSMLTAGWRRLRGR